MKQYPNNIGMLNSTYDYSKLIKMQSEEGCEKVIVKKKSLKARELPKKKQSKRR